MLLKNYGQDKKNDYTTEQLLDENLKNINGESNVEVKARMYSCIEDILNNFGGHNIAIVSHGAAIRFLLLKWCNYSYENNTFSYINEVIFQGQLDSPSALKLIFEDDNLLSISRI